MATILLLGTCDSKLPELLFVKHQLLTTTTTTKEVLLLDLSRTPTTHPEITITQHDILQLASTNSNSSSSSSKVEVSTLPRQEYITHLLHHATLAVTNLHKTKPLHAVLGIGGSCGTALATGIMRNVFPVGFPKLMVSTMASGDVKPYVEETDITMMYSVVDVAGTNRILRRILANVAGAVGGMASLSLSISTSTSSVTATATSGEEGDDDDGRKRVGITMFGVTTPCVDRIREHLEQTQNYEVYVFHATGAGGKAMERLTREHQLDAVLDLTTSEIADELVGGVLSAGPGRLSAAAERGIPQVISVGACDMVNFGTRDSVPERFVVGGHRKLHQHNPTVTIMRTTADECRDIARFMARKLRDCASRPDRIRLVFPTGSISMLDVPGQAFHDPEADAVLFDTLEQELANTSIGIRRDPRQINDPGFAVALADSLVELMQS